MWVFRSVFISGEGKNKLTENEFKRSLSFCYILTAPDCEWNIQENTHIFGAQQVPGISSLTACLSYCSSRSNCLAFDFRRSISGCYPHFNAEDLLRIGPDPDLDYYRKISCQDRTGYSCQSPKNRHVCLCFEINEINLASKN